MIFLVRVLGLVVGLLLGVVVLSHAIPAPKEWIPKGEVEVLCSPPGVRPGPPVVTFGGLSVDREDGERVRAEITMFSGPPGGVLFFMVVFPKGKPVISMVLELSPKEGKASMMINNQWVTEENLIRVVPTPECSWRTH